MTTTPIADAPHGSNATASIVVWMLCVVAALHLIVMAAVIVLFDWAGLLDASSFKAFVLIVPIVLGCAFSLGVLVALPASIAVEVRAGRTRAVPLALVLSVLSIALFGFAGWPGLPTAVVSVAASVLIWRLKPTFPVDSVPVQRRSTSVAYVLLVAGGLWGLHNFYISRAWAGVLYFALLLLGTLALGTFFTYVFFLLLGGLLIADAALMPSRIRCLGAAYGRTTRPNRWAKS